jgi:hypothetical protein
MKTPRIIELLTLLFCVSIMACMVTGCKVGNGKVDPIEGAVFSLAVGAALDARPELATPAAAVSGALLDVMSDETTVDLDNVDAVIGTELSRLNLTPTVEASFADLVSDIRDRIVEHVRGSDGNAARAVVVVRDLVQIVNDVSTARLTG